MDTKVESTEPEKELVVHQFGKLMVGSIAAFAADKLANKVYDRALVVIRSRKIR
jgi:hypothetical protein